MATRRQCSGQKEKPESHDLMSLLPARPAMGCLLASTLPGAARRNDSRALVDASAQACNCKHCSNRSNCTCSGNLVVTLGMMYLILEPKFLRAASLPNLLTTVIPSGRSREQTHSREDLQRMNASYKLRRALMPSLLIEEVRELQAETEMDIQRTKVLSAARYKRSREVSQRLAQVKPSIRQSHQHGGLLQRWRKKKLQGAQRYEGRHQSRGSQWKKIGGAN